MAGERGKKGGRGAAPGAGAGQSTPLPPHLPASQRVVPQTGVLQGCLGGELDRHGPGPGVCWVPEQALLAVSAPEPAVNRKRVQGERRTCGPWQEVDDSTVALSSSVGPRACPSLRCQWGSRWLEDRAPP